MGFPEAFAGPRHRRGEVATRVKLLATTCGRRRHAFTATWELKSVGVWGALAWGGGDVGALKLHNCTVDVKVMTLLNADVMTAVRKTVRRERRPMRAIGPFAVDRRRPGLLVFSLGNLDYPALGPRGRFNG